MNKLSSLAVAILAISAIPATASDEALTQTAFTKQLAVGANAAQVRKLLVAQNYKSVSQLDRDEDGRWTGTAMKNGQQVFISIYLPTKSEVPAVN